ncbi:MAG: hypothetical protein U0166_26155 [Acidobacteriota bacterium]
MADGDTGVRVDLVWPGGSSSGGIDEGDVIVEIDGHAVANDGTVEDGPLRVPFGLLVDRKQIGETVNVRVLRARGRKDVPLRLSRAVSGDRRGNAFDRLPRYYVYAGLVFVPLERETMKTFGQEWIARADAPLLKEFLIRPLEAPERLGQERVVLLRRLDHPVNASLAWFRNLPIERVNGREITRLEDLIEAIEGNQGRFHVIETSIDGGLVVLDRSDADAANAEILEQYGVSKDRHL